MLKDGNLTHSIYIKTGATTPRNYKPEARTAFDRARLYMARNNMYGRTIVDVLNDIKMARAINDIKDSR